MHTKISPIKSNVLIKAYEWQDVTSGGIILPDIMKYSNLHGGKDPWRGKVLAVGPDAKQVAVGNVVRYQPSNYYRQTKEIDGVRYIIIDEILIYAVEDDNENIIRALDNRVVFFPDEKPEDKIGLIYLQQNRTEHLIYGTVVAAGKNSGVNVGDRAIMENKDTWQFFTCNGKRYLLTDKDNLLATV